jgi:hypothetical protein
MTIAITLNNVHNGSGRRTLHLQSPGHTEPHAPLPRLKPRPYRKLQQHRALIDTYRPQQILPNGYAVVPMLSLRDATRMLHERNKTYSPVSLHSHFQHHPPVESHIPNPGSFQVLRNDDASLWDAFNCKYDMMQRRNTLGNMLSPSSYSVTNQPPPLVSDDDSSSYDRSIPPPPMSPSAPRRTKKSVRFAPTATMYRRSVSEEDLRNSWYRVEHYVAFEAENRRIVNALYYGKKGTFDPSVSANEASIELLGLEQFLHGPEHMMQRRNHTTRHGLMVLETYDLQRSVGQYNPEIVRRVSELWSLPLQSTGQTARQRM